MADSLIFTTELNTLPKGSADATASSSLCSLFHRRIDFHPAKKPFSGFSNGSGEFKMETLNPSSESQGQPASNTVQSTSTGKKLDRSDILENGLDPEISFGITFRRIVSIVKCSLSVFEIIETAFCMHFILSTLRCDQT